VDELAELKSRVALMDAEREILRTLYTFAHSIDHGPPDVWVDCFTEDGVFEVRRRAGTAASFVVSGRDELQPFAEGHSRAPEVWRKHVLVEPLIEIDGDAATCLSYMFGLSDQGGRPTLGVFGRYRDRLARCSDGRWRIRERIAETESRLDELPLGPGGHSATNA
jgi:SnoaL-like domain